MDRHRHFSIELDCPPGTPRPNDLIGSVIYKTGLEIEDFDTAAPFFGEQTWILKECSGKDELFKQVKPILKERVEALYNAGKIRYGSW